MPRARRWKNRLIFDCPACGYSHQVIVEGDGAWQWNGDLEKPTIRPSVFVNPGKSNPSAFVCHSFVTDGRVAYGNDCDHAMQGQTVELPEIGS